ncbi:hypothetical protein ARSEF4850_009403 [Beauveria asiatica]
MENTRAVPLRLGLDGAPYGGAASSNPRASSSPGVQSASVAMAASPYPTPAPSTSSMQTIPPDAPVQRESKRPRIISRHSGAISNTSTDLHSPAVHTSIEEAHDPLSINYPQASEMVSQPSSAIGGVASSAMPSDTYPVVGTPYWSNTSIGVEAMGKSTSQGSDANNNRLVREYQMYGNSVAWGSQDVSMTMNRMHEYIPRRMATSSWESEVPPHHHHHHQQQPQQPHQPMRSDGNLASPYEPSSSAAGSTPQMYGDYLTVSAPSAHRIVPSNAYPAPASVSTTPGTPRQAPGTAATWPRPPSLQSGPGAGGSLPRDIKPKILPSSQPAARSSVLQQSNAANADGGDRAKGSGGGGGGGGGGSGDRTTHNDVERKYRTNLKDRIAELRAAVPALQAQHDGESDGGGGGGGGGGGASSSAPKVSKGTVLSKATEYIRQLEQANRAMMHERRQLVERLHTLEAMLQNAGGGVWGGQVPAASVHGESRHGHV